MAKNEKKDEPVVATVVVPEVKIETAVPETKQEDDEEKIALKKQLSDAEERGKADREARIAAEKAVSEANTKVVSSQNDAVKAQKTAIENAVQVATGNINAIKKELREAMEGGDLDKQVELNESLSDARWTLNNATQTQKQFSAWEEQQKNAPKQVEQYTPREREWISARPDFNKKGELYEAVVALNAVAIAKGISPNTDAYFDYVNGGLRKQGFDDRGKRVEATEDDDGGRDNTGEDEVVVKAKPKLIVPSAPASNSSPTSTQQRSSRSFKLTPEMQDMAHRMFGPNSSHKLTAKQAEEKYAAHQLDIRDRRANGEKI